MRQLTPDQLVQLAWDALPARDRQLLENIGAASWKIVERPVGVVAVELCRSAGHQPPPQAEVKAINDALGIWVPEIRTVLINKAHPQLTSADDRTQEGLLTWVAWHEWGHALSVTSHEPHDLGEGCKAVRRRSRGDKRTHPTGVICSSRVHP